MTDTQAEAFAAQDTPEQIVGGLASLILMRDEFKSERVYLALFRTMAAALLKKVI
jgi:hypothetical protein